MAALVDILRSLRRWSRKLRVVGVSSAGSAPDTAASRWTSGGSSQAALLLLEAEKDTVSDELQILKSKHNYQCTVPNETDSESESELAQASVESVDSATGAVPEIAVVAEQDVAVVLEATEQSSPTPDVVHHACASAEDIVSNVTVVQPELDSGLSVVEEVMEQPTAATLSAEEVAAKRR